MVSRLKPLAGCPAHRRQAASLSTAPARDARSSRSIKDTTRQTIERSFQVASSTAASNEWEEIVGRAHVVGDVIWPLANILWRIYAEVSEPCHRVSSCVKSSCGSGADILPSAVCINNPSSSVNPSPRSRHTRTNDSLPEVGSSARPICARATIGEAGCL
jgi:hypothetical protein